MVQVYLPMGYPLQTGQEFSNVVYQGNLVRLYTLPKDPRTDAQIFQRRFLADVTKMRATMGAWVKGLCKMSMGSKWGTVLFQAIKADIGEWWSVSLDEWNDLDEGERVAWREVAPYQASYNDPGEVFFRIARATYQALEHWGGYGWLAEKMLESDAESALIWWLGEDVTQWKQGTNDDLSLVYRTTGALNRQNNQYAIGGTFVLAAPDLEWAYLGKKFALKTPQNGYTTSGQIYIDGEFLQDVSYTYNFFDVSVPKRGFHIVKLVTEGTVYLDAFEVY